LREALPALGPRLQLETFAKVTATLISVQLREQAFDYLPRLGSINAPKKIGVIQQMVGIVKIATLGITSINWKVFAIGIASRPASLMLYKKTLSATVKPESLIDIATGQWCCLRGG
jgi:hypothetical protein